MYCTGRNSKGNPCGNTVSHGKYCAWHIPEANVDKRTKPVSKKKTQGPKPVSKKKTQTAKPVSKKETQRAKPVSKKTQRAKPVSKKKTQETKRVSKKKTIHKQAHEIQKMVCMDKGRNPSQHTIVNEVIVAVYEHLFTTK